VAACPAREGVRRENTPVASLAQDFVAIGAD
jgi:hypothetical protein